MSAYDERARVLTLAWGGARARAFLAERHRTGDHIIRARIAEKAEKAAADYRRSLSEPIEEDP